MKRGKVSSTSSRDFRAVALWCGLALSLTGGGCAFGPRALEKTHGGYYEAIRTVAEEEFLRNLVHARYNEAPANLDVSSIAAQYELAGQAEARPFFLAPNPSNGIFKTFAAVLPDLQVSGSNRPTISLIPGDDSAAIRQFFSPINADTLVFLTQTGWPPSTILRLWVEGLNGVPNGGGTLPCEPVADFKRFGRLAELLHQLAEEEVLSLRAEEKIVERSGPLRAAVITAGGAVEAAKNGLEYRPQGDGTSWVLVKQERRLVLEVTAGAENHPPLLELEQMLNLVPGQSHYEVILATGRVPDPARFPREPSLTLRATPRSTAQVYLYLAHGVEVPDEHLRCGLACLPCDAEGNSFDGREVTRGLFEIRCAKGGHKPPADAYVAVKYRGWWYYIDDSDQTSKATFALMLRLSRLDFANQRLTSGPLLTLPVGR
jgi:hypothetical protein